MLRKYVPAGLLIILFWGGVLFSQSPNITEKPTGPSKPESTTAAKPDLISIKDFNPQATGDARFTVTNFSLDRRNAPDGRGDILDVYFDIINNTSEPIDLYAWVIAYYETNAVDSDERRIIPYPIWRTENPDKRTYLNRYITTTPQNIPADKIWGPEDPDFRITHYTLDRMRNAVGSIKPIIDVYPPVWKYVAYIGRYPTKGLLIKVRGDKSPGQHELIQSNYIPPTPEEKRTHIFKHIPDHTYTLEHTRRKVIFRSHHYSPYRADFFYFNNVVIMLFDAKAATAFEEQSGRPLRADETPVNPMSYYRTIRIERRMAVH